MTYRAAILCLAILLSPGGALAKQHPLTFVKRIGGGWATAKFGWMSFVAFSPNGKAIASDVAAAPDDVSGNLTVWSFPDGRLIKRLPVRPEAISLDWKYAAGSGGVADMETGKPIISLESNEFALHAFSPDSRYVAETAQGPAAARARIRIRAFFLVLSSIFMGIQSIPSFNAGEAAEYYFKVSFLVIIYCRLLIRNLAVYNLFSKFRRRRRESRSPEIRRSQERPPLGR
jgi:hypothetical protein